MKDPAVHEALKQIETIFAEEAGQALALQARGRVEKVLRGALGHGPAARLDDAARDVTLLLADLRGFTPICNAYPGGTVLALLNRCFVRMSEIIYRHGGAIDKFMGDSILAIFEDRAEGPGRCAEQAIACAVDMQLAMQELNQVHRQGAMPEMYFGIGINTGRVLSACLGSELYSEYTVIGDEVNLVSRIESFSLRGQVLVSESTYERARACAAFSEPMQVFVKGRDRMLTLREVLGIPAAGKVVPRQDARRSPRVEVTIPFRYRRVVNSVVVPEAGEGRILDVGYYGMLADIALAVAPLAEVQLEFDLPLVGERIESLFGKVISVAPRGERYRAGIEFTSMTEAHRARIQLFVQLLIQGSEARD